VSAGNDEDVDGDVDADEDADADDDVNGDGDVGLDDDIDSDDDAGTGLIGDDDADEDKDVDVDEDADGDESDNVDPRRGPRVTNARCDAKARARCSRVIAAPPERATKSRHPFHHFSVREFADSFASVPISFLAQFSESRQKRPLHGLF
jgi:hypothetical protein